MYSRHIVYIVILYAMIAVCPCFAGKVTPYVISSTSNLIPEPIDKELMKHLDELPQEKLVEIADRISCGPALAYVQRHIVPPVKKISFDEAIGFIAWHPAKNILVANIGAQMVLLDGTTFTKRGHFPPLSEQENFKIIAGGKYIAEYNQENVRITDFDTLRPVCVFNAEHQKGYLQAVGLSYDQKYFITVGSGDDGKLKIWSFNDLLQNKKTDPIVIQRQAIVALAIHPSRNILAIQTIEGLELWNIETHKLITTLTTIGSTNSLLFSPDGKYLVAARYNDGLSDEISLWNTDHFALHPIKSTKEITSLCWSPSSKYIAVATIDELTLWSIPSMKKISYLAPQSIAIASDRMKYAELSWSHDGIQLAIGNILNTLLVLDVRYCSKLEKLIFNDKKFNGKELIRLRRMFYYLSQIIDINARRALRDQTPLTFKIVEKEDIQLFKRLPIYIQKALSSLIAIE